MSAITATLPSTRAEERLFARPRATACVGAVALITLLAFEAMAVAAAMPAVTRALNGVALYALAFGGTMAASVPGMVLAGRWCDRFGAARATGAGLVLFGLGLLVAGLASSMGTLVAGRVLQGVGGGMLSVALYVGMGQVVPPALHPRLFGLFAAAWVLPGLVGPTLAAWLVQHLGWRAVFLIVLVVLPVAAALLVPAYSRLPAPAGGRPEGGGRRVGLAALGATGALLLHGALGHAWWLLACGALAAVAAAHRLLPAGSLRAAPGLPAVIALRGLLAAAFATAEVFLPLALTRDHGWSLLQAGWALSAGAISWSVGSNLQARVRAPLARRRLLAAGLLLVATGVLQVGLALSLHGNAGWVLPGWALAGLGIGLAFPMLSVLTLALSAPAEQGRNASALQLADALACSAALAAAGVVVTRGVPAVMAMAAALAVVGAAVAHRAGAAD